MSGGLDLVSLGVIVAGALVLLSALAAVVRIVRGPSILDRLIATDVLISCLMLGLGVEMVMNGHTRTIPLLVALAATAMFGTIAVARYVTKQDRAERERLEREQAERNAAEAAALSAQEGEGA
ncbi:monovalent cation/H+ antiporter complex subunit F [Schumannella sp. 10F1B-5-1]|uniref:monovalent cation/H+ antiporter complex subunit F n=1 Tax=Schumannella sp. 10F1B-5-1 TaxID=2590780 RepID=UPI00112FEA35|nr:monovalent cation/H+ antiporter complex subunit F [Schumannella sp. 10F1B-5-1]TPW73617.1 sodium:proton antiporter [Schumannella sp. 10F1B-5-1]